MKIGDKAADKISGFEGIIIAASAFATGINMFEIQPQGLTEDGKPWDTVWIEEPTCTLVEESVLEAPVLGVPLFRFGDRVRDVVSGFEGVVHNITSFLNGCTRYGLISVDLCEGKTNMEGFDGIYLQLLKASVVAPPAKKTGGPERHISSSRRIS